MKKFRAFALALIFAAAPAMAQEQAPITPMEAPAQPGAIPLGTHGVAGSSAAGIVPKTGTTVSKTGTPGQQ